MADAVQPFFAVTTTHRPESESSGHNDAKGEPIGRFSEDIDRLRRTFATGCTKHLAWRVRQLERLQDFINDNYEALLDALRSDLGKSKMEAVNMEIEFALNEIRGALMDIGQWVKPEPVPRTILTALDKSYVHSEPYGVALVMGAWNYPFQLILSPLIGALAAGNCTVVKPSDLSPATATVLQRLKDYLDRDTFLVVNGGVDEATELLKERFDMIFYTGSMRVGKIVHAAAQKHLTPVVLELGGKSPTYIHSDVDLDLTARRVLWGKFLNAGQTCVAPDYVLCHESVYDEFLSLAKRLVREFFGDNPQASADFGRIVTPRHAERLVRLMANSDIVIGGKADVEQRYVAPTIVQNVEPSHPLMQEEIFGPILPVIRVKGPAEAIDFINSRDKPLSAYVFARDQAVVSRFVSDTSSGSMCVNDVIVHLSNEGLPFGGVGGSGMGRYHGKFTFDCFSNKKSVMQRDFSWLGEVVGKRRYAPYSDANIDIFRTVLKRRANIMGLLWSWSSSVFLVVVGIFIAKLLARFS